MTIQNKSLPPSRNPPIFFNIGEQLNKPRVRKKGGPLGGTERLMIVWGFCQGWSNKEIAYYANIGVRTVQHKLDRYFDDPLFVLELPVITRLSKNSFQCRFCSETRSRRSQAQRHFLAHMFAHHIAQNIDLSDVPVAL